MTSSVWHVASAVLSSPTAERGEYLVVQARVAEVEVLAAVPRVARWLLVEWCTWCTATDVGYGVGSTISSGKYRYLLDLYGKNIYAVRFVDMRDASSKT